MIIATIKSAAGRTNESITVKNVGCLIAIIFSCMVFIPFINITTSVLQSFGRSYYTLVAYVAGVLSGFSGSSAWSGGREATALPVSEVLASTDHPIRFGPMAGTWCRFPPRWSRHEKPYPPMSKINRLALLQARRNHYTQSSGRKQGGIAEIPEICQFRYLPAAWHFGRI